jgi:hypothetical protein
LLLAPGELRALSNSPAEQVTGSTWIKLGCCLRKQLGKALLNRYPTCGCGKRGSKDQIPRPPYGTKRVEATQNQYIGTGLAKASHLIPDNLIFPQPANHYLQTFLSEGMPHSPASIIASSYEV